MGVYTGITSSTCKVLALSEWNVLAIRVLVAFSKTEIDDENTVLVIFISSNQEVIRLNISVDDSLFVDFLDTLDL